MNGLLRHPAVRALPLEDQLLITLYPGMLFGAVDKDFCATEERLRCPCCQKIFAEGLCAIEQISYNKTRWWPLKMIRLLMLKWRKQTPLSVSETLDQLIARAVLSHPDHWAGDEQRVSKRILGVYIMSGGANNLLVFINRLPGDFCLYNFVPMI